MEQKGFFLFFTIEITILSAFTSPVSTDLISRNAHYDFPVVVKTIHSLAVCCGQFGLDKYKAKLNIKVN